MGMNKSLLLTDMMMFLSLFYLTPAYAATRPVTGSYQVPAFRQSLSPMKVEGIELREGSPASLHLQMPEDLFGEKPMILSLAEDAAPIRPGMGTDLEQRSFSSETARALCDRHPPSLEYRCKFHFEYGNVTPERIAVFTFLEKKYANDPVLRDLKVRALMSFQGDPEGELVFTLLTPTDALDAYQPDELESQM